MPAPIANLQEVLRNAKTALAQAPLVGDRLNSHVGDLGAALQEVENFTAEVGKQTAEVRALLGGLTNGGA